MSENQTNKLEEFLWVDKYAPNKVSECILPKTIKSIFEGIVAKGSIPNMILSGSPGTGKTTIAVAMCREIGCDYKIINASSNRNIDLVRVDIENYASARSMSSNKRKCLILDEADGLTSITQDAMRNQIHKFSEVCSFVMTCNNQHALIPAIQSRCDVVEFKIPKAEAKDLVKALALRIFDILEKENVEYDKQVVVRSITQLYPDVRKILNRLQIYSNMGAKIDAGILTFVGNAQMKSLTDLLKAQDFNGVRQWIANESGGDFDSIQSGLFRQIDEIFSGDQSKVQFIVTSQKYQKDLMWSTNKEIHILAYLIELMATCKF